MVNKLYIYDRGKMKLGVADIDCDALLTLNEDDIVDSKEPGGLIVRSSAPTKSPIESSILVPLEQSMERIEI